MGLSKVNYLTSKIFMLQQSITNSVYLFVDDVASLEKHLTAGNHTFTKISCTLDEVRFSYTEELKAFTGKSPIAANEPENLAKNTTILNVFRRGWALPNIKITRFSYKQELYIYNIFMKGEKSGVKYSPENTVKEMRQQDLLDENDFNFLSTRLLHKSEASSAGCHLCIKMELEQQEVQNLLTTPEPIHDVQLQLVGYKQEKDDKGKKRSLNICPTTPKRIKSIYDEKNDSISIDNSLESYESHKITQQLSK
ncbi:hypothetical protein AVEN_63340-1 [Araneus ventricosus]|uniref:Uncharacterized protein n=1 Tax=Araneus ventricosus TaxID=182803 RepID=A0A4Y2PVY1_ARAVE|nr:hypothetical protein AVEN_58606-1 [Araneus ventricosus]GBN55382.1 hypothetical protein AVEN_63340-1 [Araneus ventricosus]